MPYGPGIGLGGHTTGALDTLTIRGGNFNITAQQGPGIGIGGLGVNTAVSAIQLIEIENGNFYIVTKSPASPAQWSGAGIGTGGDRGTELIGAILIKNGTFDITVVSGWAPCIGSSNAGSGGVTVAISLTVARIEIQAGTYRLTSANAAGIGTGGSLKGGQTAVGDIQISGGTFDIKTTNAPGIGAGPGERGRSTVSNIAVSGGSFSITVGTAAVTSVTGQSSLWGDIAVDLIGVSAIGTGFAYSEGEAANGTSRVDQIAISGGTFELNVAAGVGIGTGSAAVVSGPGLPVSSVGDISLSGGTFRIQVSDTNYSIGPGHPYGGETSVDSVVFQSGSLVKVVLDGEGAPGISASSVLLEFANLEFATDRQFFSAPAAIRGTSAIVGFYRSSSLRTADVEPITPGALQIGKFEGLTADQLSFGRQDAAETIQVQFDRAV
jgi:hypothetical protein